MGNSYYSTGESVPGPSRHTDPNLSFTLYDISSGFWTQWNPTETWHARREEVAPSRREKHGPATHEQHGQAFANVATWSHTTGGLRQTHARQELRSEDASLLIWTHRANTKPLTRVPSLTLPPPRMGCALADAVGFAGAVPQQMIRRAFRGRTTEIGTRARERGALVPVPLGLHKTSSRRELASQMWTWCSQCELRRVRLGEARRRARGASVGTS